MILKKSIRNLWQRLGLYLAIASVFNNTLFPSLKKINPHNFLFPFLLHFITSDSASVTSVFVLIPLPHR